MRPAHSAPLAIVREPGPLPPAARRWRAAFGRRRGAHLAVALLYTGAIVAVTVLVDDAAARLLPTRGRA